MSTEGLKIVIGADVLQGIVGIEKFNEVLAKSGRQMKGIKPASDSAGLALINLGRVAQDAPFGFIGIANNINPLLESFQRLKVESGSTKGALSALAGSLLGGGGIGLAVSAITAAMSFAAIGFDRWKVKVAAAAEAANKFAEAQHSSEVTLAKQVIEVQSLVRIAQSDISTKTEQGNALKRLNDLIPDNIGKLNSLNIKTGEGISIIRQYTKALTDQAAAQVFVGRSAEIEGKKFDEFQAFVDSQADIVLRLKAAQKELANAPRSSIIQVEEVEVMKDRVERIKKELTVNETNWTNSRKRLNKIERDFQAEIDRHVKGALPVETKEPRVTNTKAIADATFRKARLAIPDLAPDPELIVGWDELGFAIRRFGDTSFKVFDRIVPMQTQATVLNVDAAQKHAMALAATITDIVNPAFDAFFSSIATGSGNMLKAFANAIKQIIVQMIAAIAKAIIFAAILSFLPGGGTFKMPNIGKVLGFGGAHAAGGITTGPQLGLIGEAGPEAIIPLRDINKVMGMIGGGRQQVFISDTVVRGSDLVITYKRETGRLGGTFS